MPPWGPTGQVPWAFKPRSVGSLHGESEPRSLPGWQSSRCTKNCKRTVYGCPLASLLQAPDGGGWAGHARPHPGHHVFIAAERAGGVRAVPVSASRKPTCSACPRHAPSRHHWQAQALLQAAGQRCRRTHSAQGAWSLGHPLLHSPPIVHPHLRSALQESLKGRVGQHATRRPTFLAVVPARPLPPTPCRYLCDTPFPFSWSQLLMAMLLANQFMLPFVIVSSGEPSPGCCAYICTCIRAYVCGICGHMWACSKFTVCGNEGLPCWQIRGASASWVPPPLMDSRVRQ